jgi:uncharacterized protein YdaU (DUF1376 family)
MEDLAYRRLLDLYYMRELPLPADIETTAKLVRMRSMFGDVASVLREFFTLTEAGWTHSRCDSEIAKMQDKQEKARASGIASANARRVYAERAAQAKLTDVDKKQTDAERALGGSATDAQLPTPTPTPTPIKDKDTKTARTRAAPGALVSADDLVDAGVDRQHAADWLLARKGKGLPLTPTAWADTQAEAIKAGLTVPEAIGRAAANGWAGFKAAWLANAEAGRSGAGPPSYLAEKQAEAAKWARPSKPGFEFIDMEADDAPLALR